MAASTPNEQLEAGGLHGPPTLGQASIIHSLERLHWYVVDQQEISNLLEIGIQLLAILVVFGLYWLDHGELIMSGSVADVSAAYAGRQIATA